MLRSLDELKGYGLEATDGEIGRCKDFLFEDDTWTVRYMVADTGKWLPGRKVLVSPISIGLPDWNFRRIPVQLSTEQIESSPPLEAHAPVSRQFEMEWFRHYDWTPYWVPGSGRWGSADAPQGLFETRFQGVTDKDIRPDEYHLRSSGEVEGYHIRATDGEIGHVEDYILELEPWVIRYVIVDTRNWLPGRKVLISPDWINFVDWSQRSVGVDMTREAVKNSPEYDPAQPVNRAYEVRLYDFYGRPYYW